MMTPPCVIYAELERISQETKECFHAGSICTHVYLEANKKTTRVGEAKGTYNFFNVVL